MNIKILDCTIRDGGHLNNWDFDPICVKASYFAALNSGADYFELGYKFPATKTGLGKFGYCEDDFLISLFEPSEDCKPLVMIDTGKFDGVVLKECRPENTIIKGVRVTSYPYELEKALCIIEELKDKNYEVFLNLLAFSELTDEQFNVLENRQNKNMLNAIYFADSFGNFIPDDIVKNIYKLKQAGFNHIGFHAHNNLQLAFANVLKAVEHGCDYIDASIYGMGRGAGNLPIEILTGYLEKAGNSKYNTVPYLEVIERFYLKKYESFGWGYNLKSLLTGLKNIHPYYIDNLIKRQNCTIEELWNAPDFIKEKCPVSYSANKPSKTSE